MQEAKKNNPNAKQDLEAFEEVRSNSGKDQLTEASKKLQEAKEAKELAERERAARFQEETETARLRLQQDEKADSQPETPRQ